MVLEFFINPHTKNIIVGRKEGRKEGKDLSCCAKKCLNPEGKEINVKGFLNCDRCGTKVSYPENFVKDSNSLVCPTCNKVLPIKDDKENYTVTWTQKVISKHKRHKHEYFHGECYDGRFIDIGD